MGNYKQARLDLDLCIHLVIYGGDLTISLFYKIRGLSKTTRYFVMRDKITVFQPGSITLRAVLIEKCAVLKSYVNIVLNQQKVTGNRQTKNLIA